LFLNFFNVKQRRKSTPKLQKFLYSSSNFRMRSMKMLMFPCGMMTRASIADERDSIPDQLKEIVRR
jgi:hypothetical protein